jgi:hypothetical protein
VLLHVLLATFGGGKAQLAQRPSCYVGDHILVYVYIDVVLGKTKVTTHTMLLARTPILCNAIAFYRSKGAINRPGIVIRAYDTLSEDKDNGGFNSSRGEVSGL